MKTKLNLILSSALCCTLSSVAIGAYAADEKKLHIYNWSDYIAEDTIAKFEKKTGIKVVYDTFDSYESVEAKLLAGKSGYDLVMFDASLAPRLLKADIFLPLDKSKLPSWSNLDAGVLEQLEAYDPRVQYGMPYTWGTVGFTYNVDMIKKRMPNAPVNSMDMIFKPEVVSRFADCGVTVIDTPSDAVPVALSYLGLDPNSTNKSDIKAVEKLFADIRPYIKTFDSTGYLSALPNQDNCLSMTWSGDYATASMRAAEAGANVKLKYTIPREGVPVWFDALFIPSDASHKDEAHQFLEFLLQPEIIADVTNYIGYANANIRSIEHIDPSIAGDTAIYPDDEVKKRLFSKKVKDNREVRRITKAWSRIKTGQ